MGRNIKIVFIQSVAFMSAIVLGILLPQFFIEKNIEVFQIICTLIFVSLAVGLNFMFIYNDYGKTKEKLERSLHTRNEMLHLSDVIINTPNTDDLLYIILKKAVHLIDHAEKGSLMVLNEKGKLEFKALIGYDEEKFKDISFDLEDTFLYQKNKGEMTKPCIIRNVQSFNEIALDQGTYQSLEKADGLTIQTSLSSPIIIDGKLYGMLNVDSFDRNVFNDDDLAMMEFISNQAEITIKTHQLIDRILYLSRYDGLTNTYNRRHFEEEFNASFKIAIQLNQRFSLVYFDLNNLKITNDNFGHFAGDQAILTFVETVQKNIRESDIFGRYGGDEFIAVFFNADQEAVQKRIENIKEQLHKKPIHINRNRVIVKFSYGIASYPEDSGQLEELIKIADEKMYRYKESLKNAN